MKKIFILYILFTSSVLAESTINSYSHSELITLAKNFITTLERSKNTNSYEVTPDMIIKYGEFKGYVKSYLDFAQNSEYSEIIRVCVTKKTSTDIAIGVGDILSKSKTDRSLPPHLIFATTVVAFCEVSTSLE